jgi:pyridoxamine 5'-phosphate oxidase
MSELTRSDLAEDPLEQFRRWFAEARASELAAPEAMALATAAANGAPSVRMVLLKGADESGFTFFTGYASRKAGELEANPRAALLFHWSSLGRQVRIEGAVQRVPAEESDTYFATRPRGAQLAASASRQSTVLANRDELDARVDELTGEYDGRDVPRPGHWGGYRLVPEAYEFWQHRDDRMHDRFRYERDGEGWSLERLSP